MYITTNAGFRFDVVETLLFSLRPLSIKGELWRPIAVFASLKMAGEDRMKEYTKRSTNHKELHLARSGGVLLCAK